MRKRPAKSPTRRVPKRRLAEMIALATVDCYGDAEAKGGFLVMIEDNLATPFRTTILGIEVEVVGVDMNEDESIVAVCRRGNAPQRIPILELSLPSPPPAGSEWIEAYRAWLKGNW